MYTIYCHLFPNGKRYVGLTRNSLHERWGKGNKYKTCLLVNRAIEKYGWENVIHETLATAETKEEAELLERQYIKSFKTTDPNYGYNILPGGDVSTNDATPEMREKLGRGMRGKKHTEEERKKISEGVRRSLADGTMPVHSGWKHTDEWFATISEKQKATWTPERRAKMSARMKERYNNADYRESQKKHLAEIRKKATHKPMSEERKKEIAEFHTGRWLGKNSPCSRAVDQYTKDGTFVKRWDSMRDVERAGIASVVNISKVCQHKPHCFTSGGYVWRYEGEEF